MLEIVDLNLSFGSKQILWNIDMSFSPGELTVLCGPNASGKTLLLSCLSGLITPTSGRVLLDGAPYPQKHQRLGTGVGLVFQQPELQIIEQTVEQDILFGLNNLKLDQQEKTQRLEQALAWSGLTELAQRNPSSLSGGELRRLALASVFAMGPQFVLLDEPFENLDYPGTIQVLEQILKLKNAGCAVLLVTHGLEKCLAHADRLILMKSGRVIADGLPERVLPFVEDHDVRRPGGKIGDMTWLPS